MRLAFVAESHALRHKKTRLPRISRKAGLIFLSSGSFNADFTLTPPFRSGLPMPPLHHPAYPTFRSFDLAVLDAYERLAQFFHDRSALFHTGIEAVFFAVIVDFADR